MEFFTLNNGLKMPVIGLGTFPMNRLELVKVFFQAISEENGAYRSFDTAAAYGNEKWLGWARTLSFKRRDEFFITTKLSNEQQRSGNIRRAIENSLKKLNIDYVDLYLMHWPNPGTYLHAWNEMEKIYKDGLAKAIGVCNFHDHHLAEILKIANVIPAVNQIELHPLLSQRPLVEFCKKRDIQVVAYSPLARMHKDLVENEILLNLARKYEKSVNQIIFRWNYQSNIIVIPKTSKKERLRENIDIFDFSISAEDMEKIESINKNFRVRYNPDNCDFTKL